MRIVSMLTLAAPMLLIPAGPPARAQVGIHPECAGQKYDLAGKRRCTCTLEVGGRINQNGRGWSYNERSASAYDACMKQKGWI